MRRVWAARIERRAKAVAENASLQRVLAAFPEMFFRYCAQHGFDPAEDMSVVVRGGPYDKIAIEIVPNRLRRRRPR